MKKKSVLLVFIILALALISGCDNEGDANILGPQLFNDDEANTATVSVVLERSHLDIFWGK